MIKAFALDEDGEFTFVNEMPSGGEGPCFIAVGGEGNVYCGKCSPTPQPLSFCVRSARI